MNRELDKVRQMAEQMELATSTVIEPVLCLAGDEATQFGETTQVTVAVLLLLITPIGQRLFSAGTSAAGGALAHQLTKGLATAAPSAQWTPPCAGVTDTVVAQTVHHRIYRYETGAHDTCSWGFTPPPNSFAPGDIIIATGWNAKYGYSAFGSTARYVHSTTSETLLVPQFLAVPGSPAPPSQMTQPIAVVISWPSQREPANSKRQVTRLAIEIAQHMASGPGSSTVIYR
jgi:hypothetical protein